LWVLSSVDEVFGRLYGRFNPSVRLWLVSYSGGVRILPFLLSTLKFSETSGFTIPTVLFRVSTGQANTLAGIPGQS